MYFQHNIIYFQTYGVYKNLVRRRASDKAFCDKVFKIASNLKYDWYKKKPCFNGL